MDSKATSSPSFFHPNVTLSRAVAFPPEGNIVCLSHSPCTCSNPNPFSVCFRPGDTTGYANWVNVSCFTCRSVLGEILSKA